MHFSLFSLQSRGKTQLHYSEQTSQHSTVMLLLSTLNSTSGWDETSLSRRQLQIFSSSSCHQAVNNEGGSQLKIQAVHVSRLIRGLSIENVILSTNYIMRWVARYHNTTIADQYDTNNNMTLHWLQGNILHRLQPSGWWNVSCVHCPVMGLRMWGWWLVVV